MADRQLDSARPGRVRWIAIRLACVVVIALALALTPYRAIESDALAMLERMRADVALSRERLAALAFENERLQKDISALRDDPRAIEEFARRDLGMTRPGEIVYRVNQKDQR